MSVRFLLLAAVMAVLLAGCKKGPELTCKVNGVCFVCPDAKAQSRCAVDPSSARCKYADADHCK